MSVCDDYKTLNQALHCSSALVAVMLGGERLQPSISVGPLAVIRQMWRFSWQVEEKYCWASIFVGTGQVLWVQCCAYNNCYLVLSQKSGKKRIASQYDVNSLIDGGTYVPWVSIEHIKASEKVRIRFIYFLFYKFWLDQWCWGLSI